MEEELYQACEDGKVEEVQKLLQNEQININWQNQNDYLRTPFYIACFQGRTEIVKLLLSDNRVDINKEDIYGWTPFYKACYNRHIEIVKILLNDDRVDINKANKDRLSPFSIACYHGEIEVLKYMLGSGREIDVNKKQNGNADIVRLIESFQKNPNETREKLRKELAICKFLFSF